jgi:LysR family transcriptional activator of nhaA
VLLQEGPLDGLLKQLEELNLDLLLTETAVSPIEGTELDSRHVGKIPIILAANRALANKYKRQIHRLEEIPVILSAAPTEVYTQVRDLLASEKLRPRFVAEVQSVEVARLLARDGLGIAPVNAYSLDKPDRELVAVKWIFPDPIFENIYLIGKKRKYPNPLATHLFESFRL